MGLGLNTSMNYNSERVGERECGRQWRTPFILNRNGVQDGDRLQNRALRATNGAALVRSG